MAINSFQIGKIYKTHRDTSKFVFTSPIHGGNSNRIKGTALYGTDEFVVLDIAEESDCNRSWIMVAILRNGADDMIFGWINVSDFYAKKYWTCVGPE